MKFHFSQIFHNILTTEGLHSNMSCRPSRFYLLINFTHYSFWIKAKENILNNHSFNGTKRCQKRLNNTIAYPQYCKLYILKNRTSKVDQIEIKTPFLCLREAILSLWCLPFYSFNLQFQSLHNTICITLPAKMSHFTARFDANHKVIWRKTQHISSLSSTSKSSKFYNQLTVNTLQNLLKTRVFSPTGKLFLNTQAMRKHL